MSHCLMRRAHSLADRNLTILVAKYLGKTNMNQIVQKCVEHWAAVQLIISNNLLVTV